jgi:Xaa-Pro aminopeptidase
MLLRTWVVPLLVAAGASAQAPKPLPPLREQAEIQQAWLKSRLENVLPALMRRHGVQLWLVICREYNEDPVFFSLVSPTMMSARRRTIYVFFDRGEGQGVERLALGGGSNGGLYTVCRDPDSPGREIYGEAQWTLLRKIVEERKPATIAVNISRTHAFSDGLTVAEWEKLRDALGPDWTRRIVRAENLPLEYISARVPEMLACYRQMQETAHWIIRRAFSNEVILPGKTTDRDVVWWLREEVRRLGFTTWFQPGVRVQQAAGAANAGVLAEETGTVIGRGDVLHVDFGLTAMRLNTDTQHMGYVLRQGETAPPEGIRKALAATSRLQQIVLERTKAGRPGNAVLADSLRQMKAEGIQGSVYSHPVGDHGHGAGPLIGLWDRQQGVPGRGDVLILPSTWFSIELSTRTPVPEWNGKELFIGMEEDAAIGVDGRAAWIVRPPTEFHLVR